MLEVVPETAYTILNCFGLFFLLVLYGCFWLPYVPNH